MAKSVKVSEIKFEFAIFERGKQIIVERFSRTKCVILAAFDGEIHPYSRFLYLWLGLYSL
jgi:hypothetical protein